MTGDVRESIRQWLAKAESDWTTVGILSRSQRGPREVICFHCQQCIEKLLKAFLTAQGIEAPRTHDLRRLIQDAMHRLPDLEPMLADADRLTGYSVAARYPDDWRLVSKNEMHEVVKIARQFRKLLKPRLRV